MVFRLWIWILFVISFALPKVIAFTPPEEIKIELSRQTNTVYNIFNQISRQTGYFFIYDSEVVDSDKEVRIGRTRGKLANFLQELLPDSLLEFKFMENHILIRRTTKLETSDELALEVDSVQEYLILEGRIIDSNTALPLPYSTISLKNRAAGVITNENGLFKFKLSPTFISDSIQISSMGYKARLLPVNLLIKGFIDISMEFDKILLQEVTIRSFNPHNILDKALLRKKDNYPDFSSNHISFYREGIFKEEMVMFYSEAVLKEFKPSYSSYQQDQILPLQSRKISNINRTDTLIFKLKAGLQSAELMDIVKNTPDFLDEQFMNQYNYSPSGMTTINDIYAYAIDFEQKEHIKDALYKGTIYIDKESFAIISVEFEINEDCIRKIQSRFIPRPSPKYVTNLQSARYRVSYQQYKGAYHLNHVKGELYLKSRKRNRIFGDEYRIFFEKAVVQIETEDVRRLSRRDRIRKNVVFSDKDFSYDYDFWGRHNIIVPEKEISEALRLIDNKIESLVYE